MALYRAALAPLWPGRAPRLLLIWTEGPRVDELLAGELDAALAALSENGRACCPRFDAGSWAFLRSLTEIKPARPWAAPGKSRAKHVVDRQSHR